MTKKKSETEIKDLDSAVTEGEITPPLSEETISPDQAALDEIKMLQHELSETQSKANEYLDGWQRARADFANYKKRVEREQAETYQRAAGSIIKRFLDVADDLDRALNNRPAQGEGADWSNGVELINRKLLSILEGEGVIMMKVEGEPFDPNLHEAISLEPDDSVPSGHVTKVLKQGYMLGDKVLRPALVRVAQ
jgi:molecular chaperone GrpE